MADFPEGLTMRAMAMLAMGVILACGAAGPPATTRPAAAKPATSAETIYRSERHGYQFAVPKAWRATETDGATKFRFELPTAGRPAVGRDASGREVRPEPEFVEVSGTTCCPCAATTDDFAERAIKGMLEQTGGNRTVRVAKDEATTLLGQPARLVVFEYAFEHDGPRGANGRPGRKSRTTTNVVNVFSRQGEMIYLISFAPDPKRLAGQLKLLDRLLASFERTTPAPAATPAS